ncbi:MAG: flagellar basal body P-ring formation chaperone FlgA [Pirellulales bacterium]
MFRLLLATIVVALDVLPVGAADVIVQKVVALKGTVVRLGDVAKIKADDKQEAARLEALPLMPAPGHGRNRFLRMREVQDLVAAHGENMSKLNFRGELVVEIAATAVEKPAASQPTDRRAVWAGTTAASSANMNEVEQAAVEKLAAGPRLTDGQRAEAQNYIKRAIVEHLTHQSGRNADWQVAFETTDDYLAKVLDAKTALQCGGGVKPWTGSQRIVVCFHTERGPVRIRLEVDVTVQHPVVVAVQPIERGHVITAADVAVQEWANLPHETLRHQLATSLESAIGMEATKAIEEGAAIYSDDFRAQLIVHKGEEIAVSTHGGGISVRVIARARQDGARGELIAVESLEAKEPFQAVVTGPREATVFTGAAAPSETKVVDQPFRKLRQK